MQVSERILMFVAKIKEEKYAILGVYGPKQARTTIDEKEELQFIEQLETTLGFQQKNHTLIVLGGFNSKLGSSTDKVVGRYGLGSINLNRLYLKKVFSEYNLFATNTAFKQKAKYFTTWEGTRKVDTKLKPIYNTIDYIIVSEKPK